jgi:hypothetical protein
MPYFNASIAEDNKKQMTQSGISEEYQNMQSI